MVQFTRIKSRIDVSCKHDRGVQPVAQPGNGIRAGIDIEMQLGMRFAQLAETREQPLAGEERQHAQSDP